MGRYEVMDTLPDALRQEIDEWILSRAKHSASRIYRKFNLVERGIKADTFRRYVKRKRDAAGAAGVEDATDRDYSTADELLMALVIEKCESGETKHMTGIASMLRAIADRRRLEIDQQADERAQQKHDAWLDDKRRELAAKKAAADRQLDQLAASEGVPEKVCDAVKRLYGIDL